jgi:hypothetical protein
VNGISVLVSSLAFMGIPMLMYSLQGWLVYYQGGRYGMALAMFGYSLANIGLILDANGI